MDDFVVLPVLMHLRLEILRKALVCSDKINNNNNKRRDRYLVVEITLRSLLMRSLQMLQTVLVDLEMLSEETLSSLDLEGNLIQSSVEHCSLSIFVAT